MATRILDSQQPLSESDIAEVESRLGFRLPAQYRDFLLAHNGGRPEPRRFAISSEKPDDRSVVHWFFCVKEGNAYDLLTWARRTADRIPPELLPVAIDPFGNLICLSVSGVNVGKVYFWDHEKEAREGEPPGYDNVYLVADSFQEFLDSLEL